MEPIPASFRDPSGFIFKTNKGLLRQVNKRYQKSYDALIGTGLYADLLKAKLLVPHTEVDVALSPAKAKAYKVIKPEQVGFISYPYEWSFSQLKDAALATLKIQFIALSRGMTLKDASAYNIQFHHGRPLLIDTLSFEEYIDGKAWVAYRQFCQHFLAPLALMAYTDVRLSQLLRVYIDGIPLDLASELLPTKTRLKPMLAAHLHLHAKAQNRYSQKRSNLKQPRVSKSTLLNLTKSLTNLIESLQWQPKGTEWGEYYTFTNYSTAALNSKKKLIKNYIKFIKPKKVWDLGANTGLFSRMASDQQIETVAFDIDPVAVEKNYRQTKDKQEEYMLPLVADLTNPSPALGWGHTERDTLLARGPADLTLALALIHHLAISNNVPLERNAAFFAQTAKYLIIEFVPKEDSKVQQLLATREDIFEDYHQTGFETAFKKHFKIVKKNKIPGSKRTLYLMKKISAH